MHSWMKSSQQSATRISEKRTATTSGGVLRQCQVVPQNVTTASCCSLANLPASWYVALACRSCSGLCLFMLVGISHPCVSQALPYMCVAKSHPRCGPQCAASSWALRLAYSGGPMST